MESAKQAIKAAKRIAKKNKTQKFLDLSDEEILKYHPGVHPDLIKDHRSYKKDFDIKDEDEFFELDKVRKKLQKKSIGGMATKGFKNKVPIY